MTLFLKRQRKYKFRTKKWRLRVYIANKSDLKFGITPKYIYFLIVLNSKETQCLNYLRFLRPTRGLTLGELELELLEDDSLRFWLPEINKRVEIKSNSPAVSIKAKSSNRWTEHTWKRYTTCAPRPVYIPKHSLPPLPYAQKKNSYIGSPSFASSVPESVELELFLLRATGESHPLCDGEPLPYGEAGGEGDTRSSP